MQPALLVTGTPSELVGNAVVGLSVQNVHNPDRVLGDRTSASVGVRALPYSSGSAVFLLSDQPQINWTLIQHLVKVHTKTHAPILMPRIEHRHANPNLFDCDLFSELKELQVDKGGRQLFP